MGFANRLWEEKQNRLTRRDVAYYCSGALNLNHTRSTGP